jgi:hypothetical protein
MLMQFLDTAVVVCKSEGKDFRRVKENMGQCKSEHRDFKKAKERTWDSANLRAKTLREIKGNMGQ